MCKRFYSGGLVSEKKSDPEKYQDYDAMISKKLVQSLQMKSTVNLLKRRGNEMIDRKFEFIAVNPCNGKEYTQENALVLCAKDKAVPAALAAYQAECIRLGCGKEHIESVGLLMVRVAEYQSEIESKVPDTDLDCEINRCIGGKV